MLSALACRAFALTATLLFASFSCSAASAPDSGAEPADLHTLSAWVDAGKFNAAEAAVARRLAESGNSAETVAALEFERERMRRILLDFTLDEAQVQDRVRKQIPDLRDEEFKRWDQAGLFERQSIDGKVLYFSRSPSNLFRLSAQARTRRSKQTPFADGPMEVLNSHHRDVRDSALAGKSGHGVPRRVRVEQSITVAADAVPAGKTIRAWIPYPRVLPGQQENLEMVTSEPGKHLVAPESQLQRTVYLEKQAIAGQATRFSITYELTTLGQFHAIDPARVVPATIDEKLAPFVAERAPHIVFTDGLRRFSAQVVGSEKNPYLVARKLFAAVDRIPWAGAREYSTITNISDYALHAGHADCGQQTLLLMALLRLNGIPARWQSGMVYSEGDYWNLHDWGWLYLAPYGWVPMDVTFGLFDDPDPQMASFYLGGLDAYRIAFNDDYSRDLFPAKTHLRSETVDLQRGEVEWDGGNLYFDKWDYDFAWQVLPGDRDTTPQAPIGERL